MKILKVLFYAAIAGLVLYGVIGGVLSEKKAEKERVEEAVNALVERRANEVSVIFGAVMSGDTVKTPTVDTSGVGNISFKDIDAKKATDYANLIYGALVILFGYVARAFKIKTKPGNWVFVIIAIGVVLGGVFVAMGWAKTLEIAITLFASMGIFDAILRPTQNAIKDALNEPKPA
jgi:hypothetical protein